MSKAHPKKQEEFNLQKKIVQQMIKSNYYASNNYYSYQSSQPNCYYNYLYPYANPIYNPYFPSHYGPHVDASNSKPQPNIVKIEEKREPLINHSSLKFETTQQKNYLIKMEEPESFIKQKPEQMEIEKRSSKKINKQLYPIRVGQELPKKDQKEKNELLQKFKTIIREYVEETVEEQFDLNKYEPQFAKQIAEDRLFFQQLLLCLGKRFRQFKKTKEELIKLIIRRTYHNLKTSKNLYLNERLEYEKLQAFHQKNLATHKSMNALFLKRQFQNEKFVKIFKDFITNFQEQFKKENQEKIQRFSSILVSCWFEKKTSLLMHERKLPLTAIYRQKILKICKDLLKEYEVFNSSGA